MPIRHKPSAQSPDYIVFKIGETDFGAELGNAVLKYCIKQRVTYMVLSLDNPALQRAVEAILCEASDGLWYLYWDRVGNWEDIIDTLYVQEELKPQLGIMGMPTKKVSAYLAQVLEEMAP